ncbi:hypothetical protein D6827_02140 [Candidatus Parcubacteria bacterium]|nr:MAG: hypothetical protein D6827_02140 [Candidatus Parcubacteria bacterium]
MAPTSTEQQRLAALRAAKNARRTIFNSNKKSAGPKINIPTYNEKHNLTPQQRYLLQRQQEKIRQYNYQLTKELQDLSIHLNNTGKKLIQDLYKQELEKQNYNEILEQEFDDNKRQMTNRALARVKQQIRKKASEEVKKRLQASLKKGLKSSIGKTGKRMAKQGWNLYTEGSVIEFEGAAVWTWITTGTAATAYRMLAGLLRGGKSFLNEDSIISWIEPTPVKTPMQHAQEVNDIKTLIKKGPQALQDTYQDAFILLLFGPVSILFWTLIIVLVHLIIMMMAAPYFAEYLGWEFIKQAFEKIF